MVLLLDTLSTNPINNDNYHEDYNCNEISMTLGESQLDDCKIGKWVLVKYEYDERMYPKEVESFWKGRECASLCVTHITKSCDTRNATCVKHF